MEGVVLETPVEKVYLKITVKFLLSVFGLGVEEEVLVSGKGRNKDRVLVRESELVVSDGAARVNERVERDGTRSG